MTQVKDGQLWRNRRSGYTWEVVRVGLDPDRKVVTVDLFCKTAAVKTVSGIRADWLVAAYEHIGTRGRA